MSMARTSGRAAVEAAARPRAGWHTRSALIDDHAAGRIQVLPAAP